MVCFVVAKVHSSFIYRELLQTSTAADFYSTMAQFGERLRKAQLLPSSEFIQVSLNNNNYL